MTAPSLDCPCQRTSIVEFDNLLPTLEGLRRQCPALKDIFLPEEFWNDFKTADQFGGRTLDDSHHRSIILLGLERGYLRKITSPIHQFILFDRKPTKEYKQSLKETWVLLPKGPERNKNFKIYMGKLSELCFASKLAEEGHEIINLEAWGGVNDITTKSGNIKNDFEVKYIGPDDEYFEVLVENFGGNSSIFSWDSNESNDYLLLRIYESAKQLQK